MGMRQSDCLDDGRATQAKFMLSSKFILVPCLSPPSLPALSVMTFFEVGQPGRGRGLEAAALQKEGMAAQGC